MEFKDLNEEQKEKVRATKTPEDLLKVVKEEGLELTDEQMQSISGGNWFTNSGRHGCI